MLRLHNFICTAALISCTAWGNMLNAAQIIIEDNFINESEAAPADEIVKRIMPRIGSPGPGATEEISADTKKEVNPALLCTPMPESKYPDLNAISQHRTELIRNLTKLQDAYASAGLLDAALDVREQIRTLEKQALEELPPVPNVQKTTTDNYEGSLYNLRGQNGKLVFMKVTGKTTGSVYGNKIFTDDSDVATAAVFTGAIKNEESATVIVKIMPGQDAYGSTTNNDVTTRSWGAYSGSFSIEGKLEENFVPSQHRGSQITALISVTGKTTGTVWGSSIYTDDSDIGTAAVHEGLLKPGETKVLKILVIPGRSSYQGSSKNGVTTNNYGIWKGSFYLSDIQELSTDRGGTIPLIESEDLNSLPELR